MTKELEEQLLNSIAADETALGEDECLFPGRCCMPGDHYTSECHTAEDMMMQDIQNMQGELDEACARIATLEAENARLREALMNLCDAATLGECKKDSEGRECVALIEAREVLAGKEGA